jgi:hypothetical protein
MKTDSCGLVITTSAPQVVDGLEQFTADFLRARDAAGVVCALADEHPECALPQAYAAALYLYSQSSQLIRSKARPYLDRAVALRREVSEREAILIDGLNAWANTNQPEAVALFERLAHSWPQDLVSAKIAEFLFYEMPDYPRHLRFMESIASHHVGSAPFGAMHSFALELNGRYADAERVARQALSTEPDMPWAQHTLGHLFLNQGRSAEGLREFVNFAPLWASHGWPTCCHNTWHLALLHLAERQFDQALAICREQMWGHHPDDVFELVDVISLLWRFDLADHPVEGDWSAVASHAQSRAAEQVFPFLNAHLVYALARAGLTAEVEQSLELMGHFAGQQTGPAAHIWKSIGLPLVRGSAAFARREYGRAASLLGPIAADLACVGGSDAQNSLFAQSYATALAKSGQKSTAREFYKHHLGTRPLIALEQSWFERNS